jgi:phage terminase large subunit-like protein
MATSDFIFDEAAADRAEQFFSTILRHAVGEWAGEHFVLEPWQRDEIVRPLFGWKRPDGTRRYRIVWIEVPRKNGKSTLVAGIGLYLLFCDNEPAAEIYSAAADEPQAGIIHGCAKAMVQQSDSLSRRSQVYKRSIVVAASGSFYQTVSSAPETKHGFNPHGILFDEVHTQPNRELWDVLTSGSGARRQPLIVAATTAGVDRHSICWELHDHALKVRDGIIENPNLLVVIYAADEAEDRKDPEYWKREETWAAANPNYGVSVKPDFLRERCQFAISNAAAENNFKRLYLNLWTEQVTRWLPMDRWDQCADPIPLEELRGRPCWAGLDLASRTDLTALALVFPPKDLPAGDDPGNSIPSEDVPDEEQVSAGACSSFAPSSEVEKQEPAPARWDVLLWYWVPEDGARERAQRDRVPYLNWIRDGLIEATPGEVTDYSYIRKRLRELAGQYSIQEIGFDPWNATQIATELGEQDGFTMVEVRQGTQTLSEPMKLLSSQVLKRELRHGGNPVLRWNASNIAVHTDSNGNIKPDKKASSERVDGVVAVIIALSRAMVGMGSGASVYETRGLTVL